MVHGSRRDKSANSIVSDGWLLKLLPRYAFLAVSKAMKDALFRGSAPGATCGAILTIHTAGKLSQWNPHDTVP